MREIVIPASGQSLPDDPQTSPRWKWHHPVHYSFPRGWQVVVQADLTPNAQRLLLGLVAHLGWENQVTESLAIVMRKLGMVRRTVTRCLPRLEDARLISVDRSNPTLLRITVSPYLVWRGRPHQLYKARQAFEERCRQSRRARSAGSTHRADDTALAPSGFPSLPDVRQGSLP